MSAYMFLAVKRQNREAHKMLSLSWLANGGDVQKVNEQLARWEKESD